MTETKLKYSVIILIEEQHEDFVQFVQNLYDLFLSLKEPFEILIAANGIRSISRNELNNFNVSNIELKTVAFNTKVPQSVCVRAGVKESTAETIIILGAYQQLTNDSFVRLLDCMDPEVDIISPWRQQRVDSFLRRLRSTIFNGLVRKVFKSDLHDLNCTVKIFRREVIEEIEFYGNICRYLPILAARKGFMTKEVKCIHYQERGGKSGVSNIPEYFTRITDILALYFNTRFARKPFRFFSAIGLLCLTVGLLIGSIVFLQKILHGHPIGGRPSLILAVILATIGVQAAGVGLLGEIIAFTYGRKKKEYVIEKKI
jgi:hypothetical protein